METVLQPAQFVHILLSLIAFSVLGIAALQAVVVAAQELKLRHKRPAGLLRVLPPLQTMEQLLFDIVWAGMILLTLSILSGILFLDEYTTGLASYDALQLTRAIKETGVTSVAVIHQPSRALFNFFDNVLLLARGGRTVYFGPPFYFGLSWWHPNSLSLATQRSGAPSWSWGALTTSSLLG